MRAYSCNINIYAFTVTYHFGFCLSFSHVWILVLIDIEKAHRFILDKVGSHSLRIVRFTDSREIKDQLHFISCDIKQLCGLCQFRSCR